MGAWMNGFGATHNRGSSSIRGRVIHKDGLFLNNKFSNLELLPKSVSEEAAPAAPELSQENSQGCDEAEGG